MALAFSSVIPNTHCILLSWVCLSIPSPGKCVWRVLEDSTSTADSADCSDRVLRSSALWSFATWRHFEVYYVNLNNP